MGSSRRNKRISMKKEFNNQQTKLLKNVSECKLNKNQPVGSKPCKNIISVNEINESRSNPEVNLNDSSAESIINGYKEIESKTTGNTSFRKPQRILNILCNEDNASDEDADKLKCKLFYDEIQQSFGEELKVELKLTTANGKTNLLKKNICSAKLILSLSPGDNIDKEGNMCLTECKENTLKNLHRSDYAKCREISNLYSKFLTSNSSFNVSVINQINLSKTLSNKNGKLPLCCKSRASYSKKNIENIVQFSLSKNVVPNILTNNFILERCKFLNIFNLIKFSFENSIFTKNSFDPKICLITKNSDVLDCILKSVYDCYSVKVYLSQPEVNFIIKSKDKLESCKEAKDYCTIEPHIINIRHVYEASLFLNDCDTNKLTMEKEFANSSGSSSSSSNNSIFENSLNDSVMLSSNIDCQQLYEIEQKFNCKASSVHNANNPPSSGKDSSILTLNTSNSSNASKLEMYSSSSSSDNFEVIIRPFIKPVVKQDVKDFHNSLIVDLNVKKSSISKSGHCVNFYPSIFNVESNRSPVVTSDRREVLNSLENESNDTETPRTRIFDNRGNCNYSNGLLFPNNGHGVSFTNVPENHWQAFPSVLPENHRQSSPVLPGNHWQAFPSVLPENHWQSSPFVLPGSDWQSSPCFPENNWQSSQCFPENREQSFPSVLSENHGQSYPNVSHNHEQPFKNIFYGTNMLPVSNALDKNEDFSVPSNLKNNHRNTIPNVLAGTDKSLIQHAWSNNSMTSVSNPCFNSEKMYPTKEMNYSRALVSHAYTDLHEAPIIYNASPETLVSRPISCFDKTCIPNSSHDCRCYDRIQLSTAFSTREHSSTSKKIFYNEMPNSNTVYHEPFSVVYLKYEPLNENDPTPIQNSCSNIKEVLNDEEIYTSNEFISNRQAFTDDQNNDTFILDNILNKNMPNASYGVNVVANQNVEMDDLGKCKITSHPQSQFYSASYASNIHPSAINNVNNKVLNHDSKDNFSTFNSAENKHAFAKECIDNSIAYHKLLKIAEEDPLPLFDKTVNPNIFRSFHSTNDQNTNYRNFQTDSFLNRYDNVAHDTYLPSTKSIVDVKFPQNISSTKGFLNSSFKDKNYSLDKDQKHQLSVDEKSLSCKLPFQSGIFSVNNSSIPNIFSKTSNNSGTKIICSSPLTELEYPIKSNLSPTKYSYPSIDSIPSTINISDPSFKEFKDRQSFCHSNVNSPVSRSFRIPNTDDIDKHIETGSCNFIVSVPNYNLDDYSCVNTCGKNNKTCSCSNMNLASNFPSNIPLQSQTYKTLPTTRSENLKTSSFPQFQKVYKKNEFYPHNTPGKNLNHNLNRNQSKFLSPYKHGIKSYKHISNYPPASYSYRQNIPYKPSFVPPPNKYFSPSSYFRAPPKHIHSYANFRPRIPFNNRAPFRPFIPLNNRAPFKPVIPPNNRSTFRSVIPPNNSFRPRVASYKPRVQTYTHAPFNQRSSYSHCHTPSRQRFPALFLHSTNRQRSDNYSTNSYQSNILCR